MKKTLIALLALAGVAGAFDDTIWTFDGSLASQTGTGYHSAANPTYGTTVETDGNYTWTDATASYVDTGLTIGAKFGNYLLNKDLGKAITLSGGNYINLGDAYWSNGAGALGTGTSASNSYTIMAWAKFDSISGAQTLFGTGNAEGNGIKFGLTNGNQMNLCAKQVQDHFSNSLTLTANTWYNIAVSYDASTNKMSYYLNGSLVGEYDSGNSNSAGGAGAAIGSGAKEKAFDTMNGAIAELQILSGACTQAQILEAACLVPEPATATLSLLALAGLAARRRRK